MPPGVPLHGIVPVWLGKPGDKTTSAESSILISDYGETFQPSKEKRFGSHTPDSVRPPEAVFEPARPLSFEADIWTLACTIWAIIGQQALFYGFFATQDYITREQVAALGMLPPQWWAKWEEREEWFTESGVPVEGRPTRSWDDRFEDCVQEPRRDEGWEPFQDEERDAISAMLRAMLVYEPERRITAKQVLETAWMRNWALPSYEKMLREASN